MRAAPWSGRRARAGSNWPSQVRCASPYGMPTMMQVAVYPTEVIQTPKQVTIIAEAFSEVRRIYIGKPQVSPDDVSPGYYGRSVGHWEGDTLVVDTIGINPTVTRLPRDAAQRTDAHHGAHPATRAQDTARPDHH